MLYSLASRLDFCNSMTPKSLVYLADAKQLRSLSIRQLFHWKYTLPPEVLEAVVKEKEKFILKLHVDYLTLIK